MTRNRKRHGIGGAGAGDGADRARLADRGGHFGIRARLAVWNRRERLPDLPLKGRRLDVDWKIQTGRAARQVAGIDRASVRTAAEPAAAVSFALDPRAQTPEGAISAIAQISTQKGLKLTLLKVVP